MTPESPTAPRTNPTHVAYAAEADHDELTRGLRLRHRRGILRDRDEAPEQEPAGPAEGGSESPPD